MEHHSKPNDLGAILPVPASQAFPFPSQSNVSSSASPPAGRGQSSGRTKNIKKSKTDLQTTSTTLGIPLLRRFSSQARPKPLGRSLVEPSAAAGRGPYLGLKKARTTHTSTALTEAAGDHSSDPDSSEEDGPGVLSSPKQISGRSPSGSALRPEISGKQEKRRDREDRYGGFSVGNDNYRTKGKVSRNDGRLNLTVNEVTNRGYLANALGTTLKRDLLESGQKGPQEENEQEAMTPGEEQKPERPDFHARVSTLRPQSFSANVKKVPRLNIVVMVIGSRGDIQPFIKVGRLLKEGYGHRVRIATHPAFQKFVEEDSGLEFFSVGGDPAELMAFMVKNPGLIPSASTVRAGEIGRRRDAMFEMFQGFWRACINATDEEHNVSNLKMMENRHPFVADAIIANPPSFAHVHCAERLGVPLHLMFTFPYSPTQQFPHPLANIKNSNVDSNYTNFMSYPLVEMVTWQGLGDLVNRFRVKTLGLEPVSTLWAPGQLYRQKVPYTYMWSPGLIPKPSDWGPEIDVTGFVFLDLASSFTPPDPLAMFLKGGERPVYIGFGSIVVDDPDNFTSLIFEAVAKAGVRALVSKGWGGLGDEENTPDNIYMLENTPHDWLFPRVSAVVHHGGAGTTAIGLKCGKPTMIVPFFGDQPFWGSMVGKAGAGAKEPIPYKRLTSDALAEGIRQCLTLEAKEASEKIAKAVADEGDGAKNAVESFQRHLLVWGEHSIRCSVLSDRVAVWTLKKSNLRLSALAATLLVQENKVKWQELKLLRHYDWNDFEGPGEPITGSGAAIIKSFGGAAKGVGSVPIKWAKAIKRNEKQRKRSEALDSPREDSNASKSTGEQVHSGQPGAVGKLPDSQGHPNGEDSAIGKPKVSIEAHDSGVGTPHNKTPPSGDNLIRDLADETGAGLAKTGEAIAKAPMDLSLAISQGFHNAPRLYGDSTVRTAPRVNGIKSGFRAAGTAFTLGIYDGFTGLVTQPIAGAKEEGVKGAVKGVGKGFGGFLLKDLAALAAPPAMVMQGLHKHAVKGRQPTGFVRQARCIQGAMDVRALSEGELNASRQQVEAAWCVVEEIRKEDERTKVHGVKGRLSVAKEQRRGGGEGIRRSVFGRSRDKDQRMPITPTTHGLENNKGVDGKMKVQEEGRVDEVLDLKHGNEAVKRATKGRDGERGVANGNGVAK